MRQRLAPHEVRFYIGGYVEQRRAEGGNRRMQIENALLKGNRLVLELTHLSRVGGRIRSTMQIALRSTRVHRDFGGRVLILARWMDNRPMILWPAIEHRASARVYAEYRWAQRHGH